MIKIGLVQASSSIDVWENMKIIEKYTLAAKKNGCHVICFPECFLTGYFPEEVLQRGISAEDKVIKKLLNFAVANRIDILAGFMEIDGDYCYITHGAFLASGEIQSYQKTHLGEKEALYFTAGNELKVIRLSNGIKIGFQICVENHFPEISKTLSLKGAEIIFAPHAVPAKAGNRREIWNKIIPARSYDNRVYMACLNQCDEKFGGGCMVTDPKGNIVAAHFEKNENMLIVDLDTEELQKYREETTEKAYRYYPSKARNELYL